MNPNGAEFIQRHIGPNPVDSAKMLKAVGVDTLAALIDKIVPANIRLTKPMEIPEGLTEFEMLQSLKAIGEKNIVAKNFDAIVCPVMPFYAPNIGTGDKAVSYIDLSLLFNIVDMPSGVLPISLSQGVDYVPYDYDDSKQFLKQSMTEKNMPVCVQVASLPGKDEISLKWIRKYLLK